MDYNLIWDNNNNDNSIVWLDYTNARATWTVQMSWAAGLESALAYNLDPRYNIAWDDMAWRLPSTVDDPASAGYDITTSEMGHLYYIELGNQAGGKLNNTGDFHNLVLDMYWSRTYCEANTNNAWYFDFLDGGFQFTISKSYGNIGSGTGISGIAVRSGHVSVVPVPGAIWLLGSGFVGLAAFGKRRKGCSLQ